jgi:predicted aspartyl protease
MSASRLLAFLLVPSFATAASAATTLPFALTPQGGIVVPVSVNGGAPVLFLLDTGSTASLISSELAAGAGAPIVARTTLTSAGGQMNAVVVRIEHLAIGGVSASGVLATVASTCGLNLSDVAAGARPVQGVIGQDVLAPLRYTIDYHGHHIVWHDGPVQVPRRAMVFDLEPHDDRFLIRLPQEHVVLRLVPDTGADGLVLFHADGLGLPNLTTGDTVGLTGLGGTRTARRVRVPTLRIGSTTMSNVAAVVVAGEPPSPATDGLLPLHRFARVTFNGPERQLVIEEG